MSWHHIPLGGLGKTGTEGKGATSALVTHPAMPCCTGTQSIPVVSSPLVLYAWVCAVGEDWRREVGRRARRSRGMLCHMADSLLRLQERSKETAWTKNEQGRTRDILFKKSDNITFVKNLTFFISRGDLTWFQCNQPLSSSNKNVRNRKWMVNYWKTLSG